MDGKILIVEDEFIIAEDLRKILEKAGYQISGIASSVPKALEIIALKKPALVFVDIQLNGKLTGIDLAVKLNELEIPFIYVSANSNQSVLKAAKATKPFGFMVKPFRERDVLVSLDIAVYRHENNMEARLLKESFFQEEVLLNLEGYSTWEDRLSPILDSFSGHLSYDYFSLEWTNKKEIVHGISFIKNKSGNFDLMSLAKISQRTRKSVSELESMLAQEHFPSKTKSYSEQCFETMLDEYPFRKIISREFELSSVLFLPVRWAENQVLFSFYSRSANYYSAEHEVMLSRLRLIWSKIAERFVPVLPALVSSALPPQEQQSKLPTSEPPVRDGDFGLVGSSHVFGGIKKQLETIAPFDISVLILGESGTGKERIAQSIHRLSHRKDMPLVKVNCAAIPATLMESELFGHEKGSFTGAQNRRIGKFEEAIGGTIFLDEIGELPLDLQVKLLCVLQEKEIVRLGGNQTIKTDVRIIAATNRNLEKEVAEGRFRLDLYYRLNVFPLVLPPLRERKEDILELTGYFIKNLSKKMGKNVSGITDMVKAALLTYDWPGNIRELENIIERGVLLSSGEVLEHVDLPEKTLLDAKTYNPDAPLKTFKEMEKDYIFSVLKKCGGKIGGPGGAAEILDLAPTTLISKMNKLGIVKKFTS